VIPLCPQQSAFGNMMSALEAKYANGDSKGKNKKQQQQPAAAAAGGSGSKRKRGSKAAAAAAADGSDASCVEDQGPEPTDEEFAAARARLVQKAAKQKKGQAAGAGSGSREGKVQAAAVKGGDKAGKKAAGKKQKNQKA
jgi:hypothetical protein